MTSAFRLVLAGIAAALAFMAGLAGVSAGAGQDSREGAGVVAAFNAPDPSDVRGFVSRIFAARLFPDADITQGRNSRGPLAIEDIELALSDPRLAALVGEGGEWTIMLLADNSQIRRLRRGDELQGGWTVSDISSVTVRLARDDETRDLPVFPTLDNTP